MNKEQNFHISIENLETKQKESFLLAESNDAPLKIGGADNLAPKYQVGKMEYGDLTNHSVWAQSDWSQGGGQKYWEAFRDGYNIFPFTKKYFSKSGLRTVDYPGELRLGANAQLMDNFPESSGYISKIKTYGANVLVAVNLSDRCKLFKTSDGGRNWTLIYDSSTELYNKFYSSVLSDFIEIKDLAIGTPSSSDIIMMQRANPDTGLIIDYDVWDNWWQERRSGMPSTFIFMSVKRPNNNLGMIIRIPLYDWYYSDMKYSGWLQELSSKEYEIASIENDFTTAYSGTVISDIMAGPSTRRIDVGVNINRFYPNQYVDIYSDGALVTTREIRGIQDTSIVFENNVGALTNVTLKINPSRIVVNLTSDFVELMSAKDFQGNGMNGLTAFDVQIRNKRNNKIGFVNASCGSHGFCDRRCISNILYESYDHLGQLRKPNNTVDNSFLYLYYYLPEEGAASRDGYWISPDLRTYIVITNQDEFSAADLDVGDKISLNRVAILDDFNGAYPIMGIYQRKKTSWTEDNPTARYRDLYYSQTSGSSYIYKMKNPCDTYPLNYEDSVVWCSLAGETTAHYVDESQRSLCLATRNTSLVQSYIYEIDDNSSGSIASLFDVGETMVPALVKLNENIYAATNDKGRIYNWNGQSYEILERFDLDPLTNTTNITDAKVFQNKVLFVDNYNSNIMAYDPEMGLFDDLCAPEYLKASGDLITTLGVVGGSLFFGTNKTGNLMWIFDETNTSESGHLISSWYNADMPAIDKKGLYVQILAQDFIKSDAKIRIAFQFDYQDKWYYLGKERGLGLVTEPNELNEGGFTDFKSSRALYFFFPFNCPKFKTARYRIEVFGGKYRTASGELRFFRPVISNIDVFYILADTKEILFTYPIKLENRQQTLGGAGSNEIGRHRDKLEFLLNIWHNDVMVRITHVDGNKYYCIPFKPQQMTGGGMSVVYSNISASRKDLDQLSYFISIMFKNINKIDNYGK